jgi:hypothetical protein
MEDVSRALGELIGEVRGIKNMLERNDRDCRDGLAEHNERIDALETERTQLKTVMGMIGVVCSAAGTAAVMFFKYLVGGGK